MFRLGPLGAGALAVALAAGLSACGPGGASPAEKSLSVTLTGAGSPLSAPIYRQWATTLVPQGLHLRYRSVGSGTGLDELDAAKVAFAGTDGPVRQSELTTRRGEILQFPMAARAIILSYNVPGVLGGLRLTGPIIAQIFSGAIKHWNAGQITSLNPGVTLPPARIRVVHRSDAAGETASFTGYLAGVDSRWRHAVGVGMKVRWPVGSGAVGNAGVARKVRRTVDAVGYVWQDYARESEMTYASVTGLDGLFIAPTVGSTSYVFTEIGVLANLPAAALDSPGGGAYPIVSQTYLDAYRDPCRDGGLTPAKARALYEFLSYALGAGQTTFGAGAGDLPYAPVPGSVRAADNAQLKTMTCRGTPLS